MRWSSVYASSKKFPKKYRLSQNFWLVKNDSFKHDVLMYLKLLLLSWFTQMSKQVVERCYLWTLIILPSGSSSKLDISYRLTMDGFENCCPKTPAKNLAPSIAILLHQIFQTLIHSFVGLRNKNFLKLNENAACIVKIHALVLGQTFNKASIVRLGYK